MKPMKLKPRTASAKKPTANRYPDKREIWEGGHELFNRMLDEFHIHRVDDSEKDKVRGSLDKLTIQRRVKW